MSVTDPQPPEGDSAPDHGARRIETLSYEARRPRKKADPIDPQAGRAVVCAWLFWLTPIPGVLAVVLGLMALGRLRGSDGRSARWALAASVAGTIGLALWFGFGIWLGAVHEQAQTMQCASNLRSLGMHVMNYATANGGYFPDFLEQVIAGPAPATVALDLVCPASGIRPARGATTQAVLADLATGGRHVSYAYVGKGLNIRWIRSPQNHVLAFDAAPAHPGGMPVLFADGHVEVVPRTSAAGLLEQIRYDLAPRSW